MTGMTAETLAEDIGKAFLGEDGAPAPVAVAPDTESDRHFEFDAAFQTKIAAMAIRDQTFSERAANLIEPGFFENVSEAILVGVVQQHWAKYRQIPSGVAFRQVLQDALKSKIIRSDMRDVVIEKARELLKYDISDRDFIVDKVEKFAQHAATERAILKSVELLHSGRIDDIRGVMNEALLVGASASSDYDYFEEIGSRTNLRIEQLSGGAVPQGITTGVKKLDDKLYHKGWGRKELSILMGGAKSGKTTGLIHSAIFAVAAGFNVLHVTLEVSKEIVAERADANIADLVMSQLKVNPNQVRDRIKAMKDSGRVGQFKIREFPSGSMKPSQVERLLSEYQAQGIIFDLVIIDYLDIMAPENFSQSDIANSKSIWVDVRAIAQKENLAMLSATQTNREGYKSSVAKAEHVADDFNKIRTADLVISINKTEEEASNNIARLYFAASRNQAGGFSIEVRQDLEKMKFITSVIGLA